MTFSEPVRAANRRQRQMILAVALVVCVVVAVLGYPALVSSSGSITAPRSVAAGSNSAPGGELLGAPGEPEPGIPDGTTFSANFVPAVTKLDTNLLRALRRAATDAADDGVELHVNSGWRSRRDQERLFRAAVAKYGSKEEAARWVAVPGTSAHEAGKAVDLGPADATAWLSGHGAPYGLCQIYRNEPWHYELRPDAHVHGCPPMYADPTQDPRMQR